MSLTTRERGAYTRGGLIFGWKNALLIWGAYIRGSLYTGGGLFTEFYGIKDSQGFLQKFNFVFECINYIKREESFAIALIENERNSKAHFCFIF